MQSLSSLSYWPQTRVTLLVKSSLVLVFASFLGLDTVAVASTPVQVQSNTQARRDCDFTSSGTIYSISNLLECMNALAAMSTLTRRTRSPEDRINFFPSQEGISSNREYRPAPAYTGSISQYFNKPGNSHRGPVYPNQRPGYYARPPALPPGYQLTTDSSSTPGIFGINLLGALTSISQYDDRKCVPRIICEVATGSVPGNSGYKQSYASSGMNALISLLTAVDTGGSSPLLYFGKSALMGYTNRGNPEICYQNYPQCPRSPSAVVDYLNNHNGGFFRFFSNRNGGINYRNAAKPKSVPLPDATISDRKGTGELKFDIPQFEKLESKNMFTKDFKFQNNKQIVFPDDQRILNRFAKSLDYTDYDGSIGPREKPAFFPQDRMDQEKIEPFYNLKQAGQRNNNEQSPSKTPNIIYLTKNMARENINSFTFPDGQRVVIDIGFTKLFSEGYKKMLKRGLMNDGLQPIDLEGLNVINLAELYGEDDETQLEEVIHPCDMICHDSKGTAVQFSQVVSSGRLSTLMTPDRPILDLSKLLPCEVICLNNRHEKKRISTTFNKVIMPQHKQHKHKEQPSVPNNKIIKPRFIGDAGIVIRQRPIQNGRNYPVSMQMPKSQVPLNGMPFVKPAGGPGRFPGGYLGQMLPILQASQINQMTTEATEYIEVDGVPIGENPLAIPVVSPQLLIPTQIETNPIQATLTMCNNYLYIIPLNIMAMPICYNQATSVIQMSTSKPSPIIYQSLNPWINNTEFLEELQKYKIMNGDTENFNSKIHSDYYEDISQIPEIVSPTYQETSTISVMQEGKVNHTGISCQQGADGKSKHQCIPMKYQADAEYDDTTLPPITGWPSPPDEKRERREGQKIIIRTPKADMIIRSP